MRSGAESRTENLRICLYKRVMCGSKGDKKDARGQCVCTMVCNSIDNLTYPIFPTFLIGTIVVAFCIIYFHSTLTFQVRQWLYNSLVTQVFEGNACTVQKEGLFWVQRPDPNSKLMVVIITPLLRGRRHILTNNVISPPGHFAKK